ncbi:MAG: hypothetical protein INR62_06175 [Rhodospirillales bacterium]|nr:hypothetical protein [Acetobacter sp.]
MDTALRDFAPVDENGRGWLLTRIAYFVGGFFVQKHQGYWYVNDVKGSGAQPVA